MHDYWNDSIIAIVLRPTLSLSVADVLIDAVTTGGLVAIDYTDEDGVRSQRNILPRTIKRCLNGETIVKAYDPQRQDHRSFRLERIASAVFA